MIRNPPVGRRDAIQALGSVGALGFLGGGGEASSAGGGYAGTFHVGVRV